MFFDTHAHYDDKAFDEDREQLLASMPDLGVKYILNPGCTIESSRFVLKLSDRFEYVFAAVGTHPGELSDWTEDSLSILRELAAHPKCLAIGEIGLDYYWDKSNKEEQKAILRLQLELALELKLPVIIHDREAHGDILEIVNSYPSIKGVFHCFSGSVEMAEELIKRGWYIGFDGPVTYKNARKTIEVLQACPIDRILVETDSPYLSPVPRRGKRNDSGNLVYICEKIAEVKKLSLEEAAEISMENGRKLFGI